LVEEHPGKTFNMFESSLNFITLLRGSSYSSESIRMCLVDITALDVWDIEWPRAHQFRLTAPEHEGGRNVFVHRWCVQRTKKPKGGLSLYRSRFLGSSVRQYLKHLHETTCHETMFHLEKSSLLGSSHTRTRLTTTPSTQSFRLDSVT
jgi:hypothetical protein